MVQVILAKSWQKSVNITYQVSYGVSRLGLDLETGLETRFLKSRSRRSQVSSRSLSRALCLETLPRLFFYEVLQEGVPYKTVLKIIVQNLAVQRGQWLSFLCCCFVCEMEKTICPLRRLKFILNSIKNVHTPMKPQRVISAARGWEYFAKDYL